MRRRTGTLTSSESQLSGLGRLSPLPDLMNQSNVIAAIITLFVVIGLCISALSWKAGVKEGKQQLWEEAVQEGTAVIEAFNGKPVYRWRELHDLGYEEPELPVNND